jgi:hypothetical protein
MAPSDLSLVNMDPDFPVPYAGDGILLTDLTPEAIDRIVETFVGSPLLHVEVRHLGGAAAVGSPEHGVLDAIDQPFVTFTFGLTMDDEAAESVERHVRFLLGQLASWDSGRRYLNFAESSVDVRSIYPEATFERLLEVKARYDPTGMFQANHPSLARVGRRRLPRPRLHRGHALDDARPQAIPASMRKSSGLRCIDGRRVRYSPLVRRWTSSISHCSHRMGPTELRMWSTRISAAAGPQHTPHLGDGRGVVWDAAQRVGAHHGVEGTVRNGVRWASPSIS